MTNEELFMYFNDEYDEKKQNEDNHSFSSYTQYEKDIKTLPILTKKEEYDLAIKMQKGDIEARNKLILSNLRLVRQIAIKYSISGVDFHDLIQIGNIALIEKTYTFDPTKDVKFSSYAKDWVEESIRRYTIRKKYVVAKTIMCTKNLRKINRAKLNFYQEHGYMPSELEISKLTDLSLAKIHNALMTNFDVVSIETPVSDTYKIEDTLYNEEELVENIVENNDTINALYYALSTLSDRELELIKLHFGLEEEDIHNLRKIGEKFGCTYEAVRKSETKILKKLSKIPRLKGL